MCPTGNSDAVAFAHPMKLSHLHIAFVDFDAAVATLQQVLGIEPQDASVEGCTFNMGEFQLAVHPDWGHGDTSLTLALQSDDCRRDFAVAVARGARARTAPHQKEGSLNADVFGPGRLIIEFEERSLRTQPPAPPR